jgi:hypothetical protein
MTIRTLHILTVALLITASAHAADRTVHVTGSGFDGLNAAIIHSKQNTATGFVQHSTEIIELTGDLTGRVLDQVTSVVDLVKGTLTNTGDEVFSGTIAGSDPVMIHDDQSRFVVNLVTGEDSGDVFLTDNIAGPKVRCTLHVVGTGTTTADGNPKFTYSGDCVFRGN